MVRSSLASQPLVDLLFEDLWRQSRGALALRSIPAHAGNTAHDLPSDALFDADEDEALLQAADALESALAFYVEDRKPLPAPSKAKRGQRTVRPSALECAKLGVYQAMVEQGVKKSELARRVR